MDDQPFGDCLREARVRAGVSAKDLANMLRVNVREVEAVECGSTPPSSAFQWDVSVLCRALRVHTDELVEWLGKDAADRVGVLDIEVDQLVASAQRAARTKDKEVRDIEVAVMQSIRNRLIYLTIRDHEAATASPSLPASTP